MADSAEYTINVDLITQVIARMQADPPEQLAYWANLDPMERARRAFSTDEDNNQFGTTLDQIKQEHLSISEMYQNVIQILATVTQNYEAADDASASRLS